jgi:hypothetical protein
MHEVVVRGHSLRRIETAMQRSELSLLTALSGKQRALIPDGQPVVLELSVTETEISTAANHTGKRLTDGAAKHNETPDLDQSDSSSAKTSLCHLRLWRSDSATMR